MSLISTLFMSVFAGLAAAIGHELCHYLVAWAHGWPREIDVRKLETYVMPRRAVADWEVAVFAMAPAAVGALLLPLLYLHPSVPALIGWSVLTLGGIRNDSALAIAGATALAAGQAPNSGSTPDAAVEVTD